MSGPHPVIRVVFSGCSGGGKSTLIGVLAVRGYATFPEPGRIIVAEEQARGGTALPWRDTAAFATRAIEMSLGFHADAIPGLSFYDRSFIDALAWFERSGRPLPDRFEGIAETRRFHDTVIMVPPWPGIYRNDPERKHGFDEAVEEYDSLLTTYAAKGYDCHILSKSPIEQRVTDVLQLLGGKAEGNQ